ncbi:DUF4136 domain-containing protein [Phenylobacterium terrae]|uniref:DUF4136 domain-containing protein n=1 Tax=Phenylobacterium terrae TaxID=2665495 RepID=A0ABW4N2H7_9CAUL
MRPVLSCLAALAIAATAPFGHASAAPAVTAEKSPDFKGYRTYSWVFQEPPAGLQPGVYEAVKASIGRALAKKGYVESASGDMAVAFWLGRRDRIEKTDWGAYGGDIYTRLGVTPATGPDQGRAVTDGTLAIDLFDAATKQPVWRSTAVEELPPSGADRRLIDKAVGGALKPLPAAAK